MGCADGAATSVKAMDIRVEGVVFPLFQGLQLSGQCVFRILFPGLHVFERVLPFHFELLIVRRKGLGENFPLGLGVCLPGRYQFLNGPLTKVICL